MRNGIDRLHDRMVPAQLPLLERTLGIVDTKAMAVVAELGIADRLADGPADAATLAAATSTDPDALERLLRYLVARRVFRRGRDGRYRNTRISARLAGSDPASMRAWTRFYGAPWHVAIWNELGHAVRTGDAAATVAFGRPFWAQLTEHDLDAGAVFDAAMADASRLQADLVTHEHDFSSCRAVCDVGGGTGTLLAGILAAKPQLHGTLFDLPAVVAKADATLHDAGVADRVTVVAGDFFTSVPRGCDRYLLQAIVHDWDDESCVHILSNVRDAMPPGGRVLVLEQELPRHDGWHLAKALDLEMLVDTGAGRERTREEFEALFARAGLRVTRRGALPVLTIFELAAA
jgi:O-methyltransferase/methyltransferase family protein